jgi:hypothetical protein
MFSSLLAATLLATSALAHSNMFVPTPRQNQDSAFTDINQNGCDNENTNIPGENNFQRGQKLPVKCKYFLDRCQSRINMDGSTGWWNNHSGGFIKMALIQSVTGNVGTEGKTALLANENSEFPLHRFLIRSPDYSFHHYLVIQGQCYTRKCNRDGFDPGQTHECEGAELEIPNWVSDGEYTLQWSHFGGYDSDGVPTRQLPIYHTCANIRVNGGVQLQNRPSDWVAPFFGGDEVQINGKSGAPDQCAFKKFGKEPQDPSVVNVKDDDASTIQFGRPDGWATSGKTNQRRADAVHLPRLGRVARNVQPHDHHDVATHS